METAVGEKKHFVLVHGVCHGAWVWYKLATLLAAAGHKVTAPDLAACGTNARRFQDVRTFSEYSRPLMEVMGALPRGERVVLVGHSFGGLSVAMAAESFPEKVAAAVFVSAFVPDTSSSPSYVLDEYLKRFPPQWMDTQLFSFARGSSSKPLTSFRFGPKLLSSTLYQHCSPVDLALAKSRVRVGSFFTEDLAAGEAVPPFSEGRYGSVKKVYVVCGGDLAVPRGFQLWVAEICAADEVRVVEGADHMAMLSKPRELCRSLLDVANMYL